MVKISFLLNHMAVIILFLILCLRGISSKEKEVSCSTKKFDETIKDYKTSSLTKKTVLVTGAGGFIGSHIADICKIALNFHVVALDNFEGGFMHNLNHFTSSGGVVESGDIRNVTFINHVFQIHGPFHHIYHVAAYAAKGLSHFIRHFNYENNLVGSVNILNAAIAQNPMVETFVFTSSIAAYGASDGKVPFTETSPKTPEDPYGIAKLSFELDLQAAHHMFGLRFIIFRPHNVYGPRQNIADKFRNAIGIFMNQILRNEEITIFGNGEQTRAFSYISDVARVIASSVIFPDAYNNDFFVGSDKKYSVNYLANAVINAMGATNVSVKHLAARDEVVDAFPIHDKLRCIFNPPTPVDLDEGLKLTARYVKNHGSFEPTGYSNIEISQNLPPSWSQWLQQKGKQQSVWDKVISTQLTVDTACQSKVKDKAKIIVFIPTPIKSSDRRAAVFKQFQRENWSRAELRILFIIGTKTGARLETDLDYSSVYKEDARMEFIPTICRDFGDEYNNGNGTSSTTCKVYEALKYIVANFEAQYVWRGADDAYLNLRRFVEIIPELPPNRWWLGKTRVINPDDPNADVDLLMNKQPNLQNLFKLHKFPDFMSGAGFAFSWDVAVLMGSWNVPPHLTWCEDVMVGLWLTPFQITKVSRPNLINNRHDFSWDSETLIMRVILMHYMKADDWNNIADDGTITLKGK